MGIGDNLMFLRALSYFEFKDKDFYWLVKPEIKELLNFYFPESKIITFGDIKISFSSIGYFVKIVKKLRKEIFKDVIILDYKSKPLLAFLFLLISSRISNIKFTPSEELSLFYKKNPTIKKYKTKHEVERYKDLLKPLYKYSSHNKINFFFDKHKSGLSEITNRRIILIAPGSYRKAKRWSVDNFIELSRRFLKSGYEIIFVGGKTDCFLIPIIENYFPNNNIKNFIGKLSLKETGDLIKESTLVVSNDSALMHYADLLMKPVISIFGITDPRRCGPFTQIENCIVNNSYYPKYSYGSFPDNISDKYINEITVDEVFEKFLEVLSYEKN